MYTEILQNGEELERSDGLVLCAISHREAKISIFAGMMRVSVRQIRHTTTHQRGAIVEFSRKSRKRMLERLACTRNMGKAAFITLTYPASYPDNAAAWKRDLDTFFKRLRRLSATCHAVWRIEPQQRGAPHFHILLFNHPSTLLRLRRWVRMAWYAVVNSGDEKHLLAGTQTNKVYDRKHAIAYAAKYAAKPSEGGRRFVTLDGEVIENVGKHWGVFNAAAADCEAFGCFSLSPYEVIELRRMCARFLKSKGSRYAKRLASHSPVMGFSVFGLGDDSVPKSDNARITILRMLVAVAS